MRTEGLRVKRDAEPLQDFAHLEAHFFELILFHESCPENAASENAGAGKIHCERIGRQSEEF